MDESLLDYCLEPDIHDFKNTWHRRKTLYEVAAAQSTVGNVNYNLPNSLLLPLITVLDPGTASKSIHARIDWNLVEARLLRNHIIERPGSTEDSEMLGELEEDTFDSQRARSDSPAFLGRFNGEAMEVDTDTPEEKREKNAFVDEIVDLIRNIKKYNDSSISSSQTWIEKSQIEKISRQLILIQCYLPGLLPLEEVVNGLLFEHGPQIIENIVIEMPEHAMTFVNILASLATQGTQMKYRNTAVTQVLRIFPYFARRFIDKFSLNRNDVSMACRLADEFLKDKPFLEFLEPLLTDRDSVLSKTVFRIAGRQVFQVVSERLLKMVSDVNAYHSPPDGSRPPFTEVPPMALAPWSTRLSFCLVELLSSSMEVWKEQDVINITKFVFRTSTQPYSLQNPSSQDEEEPMDLSLREDFADSADSIVPDSNPEDAPRKRVVSGAAVEPSPFGDAHEIFVLSALIAMPFFTQYPINQTGAVQPPHRSVDNWLDMARKRVLMGDKVTSSFGSHLIYVHSCIMSSRIEELAEFASDAMKRRVELSQRHNHTLVLKNAFTTRCMTEIEVAKRSACQPITRCLRGGKHDERTLALRSIHALQSAGVYKTFVIDIGSWLERQLESISLPVSELLADVVDGFAQSSAQTAGKGLSQEFIENAFNGDLFDARTIPKRLFVLLFLCSYREAAQRIDSSLRNIHYDLTIYRKIPVRYLLTIMEHQHENFESIRSKVMLRCGLIFPYLLPTPESMDLIENHQKTSENEIIEEEEFGNDRETRIRELRELKDMPLMLETIDRSSLRDQLAAMPILIDIFMESLKPTTPPGYENVLISIFNRYEQLHPRPLFELSAATWLRDDPGVELDDVMKIPSLLFRCDRRILNSPPHFYCLVRALNFFNKMVRAENRLRMLMIQTKAAAATQGHRLNFLYTEVERKEKDLLNGSYLDTQHSVLIHALIECCDSKRMKDDPDDYAMLEKRQQIRGIACQYIHRTFLDHEGLIRIVLYQKFPFRQIRDLVEGVPALFAGNALILDMLSLADQQRRFFAVVFAAEICRKYRVRESLETARIVCDIVHSLHKFGELPSSKKLWKHVAPALMVLATEFPSLADSINRLLLRVSATAKNRLAVRAGFLAADRRLEEHELIDMISSFMNRNSLRQRL